MAGQLAFPVGFFFTGYISDKFKLLRGFLILSLLIHAPAQYLFYTSELYQNNLIAGIILSALNRFLFAVNFQLIGIAVLESTGMVQFGRVRAWGTIGFFFVHLFLFITETTGGIGGFLLPGSDSASETGRMGGILHLITAIAAIKIHKYRDSEETYYFREAVSMILQKRVAIFMGLSFLFFFSYQIVDFYLGRFLQSTGGMSIVYAGWTIAVILEIPFLMLSGKIYHRFGIRSLLITSLSAGIIRFLWLGIYSMRQDGISVVFSQILHGIHFTGYYMGAIYWMRTFFPSHLYGTGYGAYVVISSSLGGTIGSFVYGKLLFSGQSSPILTDIYSFLSSSLEISSISPFFSLFLTSLIIHLLIILSFILYKPVFMIHDEPDGRAIIPGEQDKGNDERH